MKGAYPIAIKYHLRHSDIRVTVNHYIGTDPDHQKKIVQIFTLIISQDERAPKRLCHTCMSQIDVSHRKLSKFGAGGGI